MNPAESFFKVIYLVFSCFLFTQLTSMESRTVRGDVEWLHITVERSFC